MPHPCRHATQFFGLVLPGQPRVAFGRLFCLRMAGESVNKVTPLASMGGEPLKALLLTRTGSTLKDAAACVAISKNSITMAQIAFIFVAVGLAFPILPGRSGLLLGFLAFPGAVFAATVITAVLDVRLRRHRKLNGPAAAAPGKKSVTQAAIDMWAHLADFYWENPRAALISFGLFFLGWAAGAVEILAGCWLLDLPMSVEGALVMEGALVSINMATFFIPANAGAQEGGLAFLAPLLGLTTGDGVALAVLRRCRDVVWILFGLLWLFVTEGRILIATETNPADPSAVESAV